jgi:hypothetical protein
MLPLCRPLLVLALLLSQFGSQPQASQNDQQLQADVVVYGGTSAGVIAAIHIAEAGKQVILIEPTAHLGGMTSNGLGWTDLGQDGTLGGRSLEFYRRVHQHYAQPSAWRQQSATEFDTYFRSIRPYAAKKLLSNNGVMSVFEPHVTEKIFNDWIASAGVRVLFQERLLRNDAGVHKQQQHIHAIQLESGLSIAASLFIDASYEGDLMATAGVSYTIGREAASQYNETTAGFQPQLNKHYHRFTKPVDPYVEKGNPESGLLPGIEPPPTPETGAGDHRLQAFCFRMCLTNDPGNRALLVKPADYQESDYELLLRNFEAGDMMFPMQIDPMPNAKSDVNNKGAFSTDFIGGNYRYPEASYAEREQIIAEHLRYQQGLLWTLANHPRVPAAIREEMNLWGPARDEFASHGHWPYQLYIRESRRMISDYVMTEADCYRQRIADDAIGLGSYNLDSHNVQRFVDANGFVQNEGDVQVSPGGPYAISYRSIVPRADEVDNLLVPVCLSASHMAYGSIRMEPVFMVLGHSAAEAALIALEKKTSVQQVPYALLRERLTQQGQIVSW